MTRIMVLSIAITISLLMYIILIVLLRNLQPLPGG